MAFKNSSFYPSLAVLIRRQNFHSIICISMTEILMPLQLLCHFFSQRFTNQCENNNIYNEKTQKYFRVIILLFQKWKSTNLWYWCWCSRLRFIILDWKWNFWCNTNPTVVASERESLFNSSLSRLDGASVQRTLTGATFRRNTQ